MWIEPADDVELLAGRRRRRRQLDGHLERVREQTSNLPALEDPQFEARRIVENLAVALQASLLVRFSTPEVADAFCAARLNGEGGRVYGTLPSGVDAKT